MKRLLLVLTLALVASACDSLDPKAQAVKACKEILVSSLWDMKSYKVRSEYKTVQSEKDNPIVYGWEWNSRNHMGGYTQPNTQLCYLAKDGNIVTQSFGVDDIDGMKVFLRATSPKLQQRERERQSAIAKEKQLAEERRKAEAIRQQRLAAIAEEKRWAEVERQHRLAVERRRVEAVRQRQYDEKRRRALEAKRRFNFSDFITPGASRRGVTGGVNN